MKTVEKKKYIVEKWNCKWQCIEYTMNDPFFVHKTRVHMKCIESNNEHYPVGSTVDYGVRRDS